MSNIDRIVSLAKEQGVSLAALCKKIGKSRTYLSEIASRQRAVPQEYISPLAEALHTTPDYLLGKTDKKNKPTQELSELSPDDMELLDAFRKAPPEKRKAILDLLK